MRLTSSVVDCTIPRGTIIQHPLAEFEAMPMNCAFCGELIEDDPVRRGSLYFCSPECQQDYLDREAEEEEGEEEDWERDDL